MHDNFLNPTKGGNPMRWSVTVMVLLATSPSWAEQPKGDPADEKALRAFHREFVAAYNKGDAEAVAAFYAPDADFVGFRGDTYHGRAEIQKRTANFFAQNKGIKLKSPFGSLRFLTPDVAIADRSEELTPNVEGGVGSVHATVVYVKRDGKWLQASVRLMVPFQPSKRP
jgi:uncharacterized protein (TIGR02246 family)